MNIKEKIRTVKNFPKTGVDFLDITTILSDPLAFKFTVDWLEDVVNSNSIKSIVAIDARGFIWGGAVGAITGIPLFLARKSGKLPGATYEITYNTEYSTATVAMLVNQKIEGPVMVIDDIIATGGTSHAVGEIINTLWHIDNHNQIHCAIADLSFLGGKSMLEKENYRVTSLVSF